jgi:hypothetical protein
MSSTLVQLSFTPKRMLTKSEAAQHCGRSVRRFKIECPVQPVMFTNGDFRWDVRDLDSWIDGIKMGSVDQDADAIVARLK